jgi:hypothetical protein
VQRITNGRYTRILTRLRAAAASSCSWKCYHVPSLELPGNMTWQEVLRTGSQLGSPSRKRRMNAALNCVSYAESAGTQRPPSCMRRIKPTASSLQRLCTVPVTGWAVSTLLCCCLAVVLPHNTAASLYCCRVLFQQLMVALDYLHAKGAAHRDIKLENTLLKVRCQDLLQTANNDVTQKGCCIEWVRSGSQAACSAVHLDLSTKPQMTCSAVVESTTICTVYWEPCNSLYRCGKMSSWLQCHIAGSTWACSEHGSCRHY